jgi:hypothetical protein
LIFLDLVWFGFFYSLVSISHVKILIQIGTRFGLGKNWLRLESRVASLPIPPHSPFTIQVSSAHKFVEPQKHVTRPIEPISGEVHSTIFPTMPIIQSE